MDENTPGSASTPPNPSTLPPASPPPPLPPPPVIRPAGGSQPPRRGRGWMVVAIILLVLLAVSVLFNIGSFLGGLFGGGHGTPYATRTVGPKLEEMVREDNGAVNKIAVIEVNGIITSTPIDAGGSSMVEVIRAQLKHAQEDGKVKAVILKVDSPGGEVLASDDINHALSEFQSKSGKPVIVSMGNLAASGGYYISAPCRWIVANELSLTGSIGVIMSTWNYRGLMDKVGLLPLTFKSGKYKDMLSGSREPSAITPEERDMVQSLINDTYQKFRQVVREGRDRAHKLNQNQGVPLSNDWTNYADGRVLSGKQAFDLGFVDELGTFDTAVSRAKTIAGISSANLVQYEQRYDLSDFLHIFGKSDAKGAVKIDLGLEAPKLKAGQPYFISTTLMP